MRSNTIIQADAARAATQHADSRVHTSLADLLRLEHLARGFSLLPRQPIHSLLSGRHASRLRGRGLDFEELRHYRLGDDVRTIDWKATNRTGKPQVRVFTEERDRPAIVVVDQRQTMFFGSRRSMKSVAAAEAAAMGVWRVLDQVDRVVAGETPGAVMDAVNRTRAPGIPDPTGSHPLLGVGVGGDAPEESSKLPMIEMCK